MITSKKKSVPQTTVTRDLVQFGAKTGNLYESVVIMAKRSNQIAQQVKQDLETKLQEFATVTDNPADEIQTNDAQIELSKAYERQPKPTLVAAKEFEDDELVYSYPMDRIDSDEEPSEEA